MLTTVHELLQSSALQNLSLVGGAKGAEHVVTNVITLDNPEMVKWMKNGEMLLTTGYHFKEDTSIGLKLIQDLSEANCSALGIKVKRYLEKIPAEMIAAADQAGFSLIEIPYYASLSEVSEIILKHIFNKKMGALEGSEHISNQLMEIILNKGTIHDILNRGESLLGFPMALWDSDCNFSVCSYSYPDPNPETAFLPTKPKSLPDSHEHIEISTPFMILGHLIAYHGESGESHAVNRPALERFISILAILLLKEKNIEDEKAKAKRGFFNEFLEGRISSLDDLETRGAPYGLNIRKRHLCLVLQSNHPAKTDQIKNLSARRSHIVSKGNEIVVLLELFDKDDLASAEEAALEAATSAIRSLIKDGVRGEYVTGIGELAQNAAEIPQSYAEASCAANMLKPFPSLSRQRNIAFYRDNIPLYALAQNPRVRNIYAHLLDPLAKHDRKNGGDLLKTMETLISCKHNHSQAAKALFIHRNTLEYRVEKIKTLLDSDLTDAEEWLALHLGLIARKIEQARGSS